MAQRVKARMKRGMIQEGVSVWGGALSYLRFLLSSMVAPSAGRLQVAVPLVPPLNKATVDGPVFCTLTARLLLLSIRVRTLSQLGQALGC